jgi:hypothetical protein
LPPVNKSSTEKNDQNEKVLAWNRTPSIVSLQKHVMKHTKSQSNVSFKVDHILKGDRTKFKSKGPLEKASEELLEASAVGDMQKVEDLLTGGKNQTIFQTRKAENKILQLVPPVLRKYIRCTNLVY